jgi:hypothetical protein
MRNFIWNIVALMNGILVSRMWETPEWWYPIIFFFGLGWLYVGEGRERWR